VTCPPSSRDTFFRSFACGPDDEPTDFGRAGEGHLVDAGMRREAAAPAVSPKPVMILTTPGGSPALVQDSANFKPTEAFPRRPSAPPCSRSQAPVRASRLPSAAGSFHGMIWPDDAHRLGARIRVVFHPRRVEHGQRDGLAVVLGAQPAMYWKMSDRQRDIRGARDRDRLARYRAIRARQARRHIS